METQIETNKTQIFTQPVMLALIGAVVTIATMVNTYFTVKINQKADDTIAKVDTIHERTQVNAAKIDSVHRIINGGLTVRIAEAETSGVRKGILQGIEIQKEEDKENN